MSAAEIAGGLQELAEAIETGTWADVITALLTVKSIDDVEREMCASRLTLAKWERGTRMRPSVERSLRGMVKEWIFPSPPEPTKAQLADEIAQLRTGVTEADRAGYERGVREAAEVAVEHLQLDFRPSDAVACFNAILALLEKPPLVGKDA